MKKSYLSLFLVYASYLCFSQTCPNGPNLYIINGNQSVSLLTIPKCQTFTATIKETNNGAANAIANFVSLHLSKDAILTPGQNGDMYLGEIFIPGPIPKGNLTTNPFSISLVIPPTVSNGGYYLYFSADGDLANCEQNELDNFASVQITVTNSITPPVPNPSFGSVSCPGTQTTTNPTLTWTNATQRHEINISQYPYGMSNIIYTDKCVSGTSKSVSDPDLVPGKLYRWNMNGYTDPLCNVCSSVVSPTLYFHIPPTISAQGSTTLCQGSSVKLITPAISVPSPGVVSYQWYKNGMMLSGETSISLTTTTAGNFNIKLTYQGSSACGNASTEFSNSIVVSTCSNPVICLSGNLNFGSIQVGNSLVRTLTIENCGTSTLNVTSISYPFPSVYSGNWSGNISPNSSQNVLVTFAPTNSATYNGNVTVFSNGTGFNTIAISGTGTNTPCVSSSAPISAIANPSTIIMGESSFLKVNGGLLGTGASWKWYRINCGGTFENVGSGINGDLTVSPSITTTYFVRAEGNCGITNCKSVVVNVNSIPCIISMPPTSASATPSSVVNGGTSLLQVNGGSLGTGATWKWYSGNCNGVFVGNGSGLNGSLVVTPNTTTTYFVKAEGNCNTTTCKSAQITVVPMPGIDPSLVVPSEILSPLPSITTPGLFQSKLPDLLYNAPIPDPNMCDLKSYKCSENIWYQDFATKFKDVVTAGELIPRASSCFENYTNNWQFRQRGYITAYQKLKCNTIVTCSTTTKSKMAVVSHSKDACWDKDDRYAWDASLIDCNDVGICVYAVEEGDVMPHGTSALEIRHPRNCTSNCWYSWYDNIVPTKGLTSVMKNDHIGHIKPIADPHLHFGVYYKDSNGKLISVNRPIKSNDKDLNDKSYSATCIKGDCVGSIISGAKVFFKKENIWFAGGSSDENGRFQFITIPGLAIGDSLRIISSGYDTLDLAIDSSILQTSTLKLPLLSNNSKVGIKCPAFKPLIGAEYYKNPNLQLKVTGSNFNSYDVIKLENSEDELDFNTLSSNNSYQDSIINITLPDTGINRIGVLFKGFDTILLTKEFLFLPQVNDDYKIYVSSDPSSINAKIYIDGLYIKNIEQFSESFLVTNKEHYIAFAKHGYRDTTFVVSEATNINLIMETIPPEFYSPLDSNIINFPIYGKLQYRRNLTMLDSALLSIISIKQYFDNFPALGLIPKSRKFEFCNLNLPIWSRIKSVMVLDQAETICKDSIYLMKIIDNQKFTKINFSSDPNIADYDSLVQKVSFNYIDFEQGKAKKEALVIMKKQPPIINLMSILNISHGDSLIIPLKKLFSDPDSIKDDMVFNIPILNPKGLKTFIKNENIIILTEPCYSGSTFCGIQATHDGLMVENLLNINVIGSQMPQITANGPTTFCQGFNALLTSSKAKSYNWNNGITTQAITVNSSGNYIVTVTDENGCTSESLPVTIEVIKTISLDLGPDKITSTCSTTLDAKNPNKAYLWSTGEIAQKIYPNKSGKYSVLVTDEKGCQASDSIIVSIIDNIKPKVLTQNTFAFLDSTGKIEITPSMIDKGSSDNCGIATLLVSPKLLTCKNKGPNKVLLTVTDINGNTATATSIVNVIDLLPPKIICPPDVTVNIPPGQCSVFSSSINLGNPISISDNCNIKYPATNNKSKTIYSVGENYVTWTIADSSNNAGTCIQKIIVMPICGLPTKVTYSDTTSNSAKVKWLGVNCATGYELMIKQELLPGVWAPFSSWSSASGPGLLHTFTGLKANKYYGFQIRAKCGTAYSEPVAGYFHTKPGLNSGESQNRDSENPTPNIHKPSKIIVVPNPAREFASLIIEGFENNSKEITMYDMTSKLIFNLKLSEKDNELELDLKELIVHPGVYLIRVSDFEKQQTAQLIIEK